MAAVTVSRSQGRLVAVKQVQAGRAGEVEREAELLKRLEHPGLVRFVDLVETDDGGRALHTEFVNSDTWATRPLTDPSERAAAMAALAAVVADLHQLGVAHLQLTPPHVLHGEHDRPVLCGLTLAAEATPENRQTDLDALADLCHDPSLGRGALSGKLSSLADAARSGRLSARELARRLDLLAAKRPVRSPPARARSGVIEGLKRRCRPKPLIASGAVLAAVVVAFALGARSRGFESPPIAPLAVPYEATDADIETAQNRVNQQNQLDTAGLIDRAGPINESGLTDPTGPVEASTAGILADPSGAIDSLAPEASGGPTAADSPEWDQAVSVRDAAAVLEHGGRRYAVGTTGDFIVTGDWDCDGQPTAAIVRPSTGGIALFDAWPGSGETISLPVRWTVGSPTGAEAVAHGRCDLLRVYTTAGSRLFNPAETP